MTQVISRLFDNEKIAQGVVDRLRFEGIPPSAMRLVTAESDETPDAIADRLGKYDVAPDAATLYAKHMADGKAAVVVHASYKPLGAAKLTRSVMNKNDPINLGDLTEETFIPDRPSHAPSILDSHPLFLSTRIDQRPFSSGGPISRGLGPQLLLKSRPRNSAIRGGKFMSRGFWPMPLVKTDRNATSAIRGGKYMSKAFWPMPLLSRKKRSLSVIHGGALPLSRALGFPAVMTRR